MKTILRYALTGLAATAVATALAVYAPAVSGVWCGLIASWVLFGGRDATDAENQAQAAARRAARVGVVTAADMLVDPNAH